METGKQYLNKYREKLNKLYEKGVEKGRNMEFSDKINEMYK